MDEDLVRDQVERARWAFCRWRLLKTVNYHFILSNISFDELHAGQTQESGSFSKGVPGDTPLSGSPFSGLYT